MNKRALTAVLVFTLFAAVIGSKLSKAVEVCAKEMRGKASVSGVVYSK